MDDLFHLNSQVVDLSHSGRYVVIFTQSVGMPGMRTSDLSHREVRFRCVVDPMGGVTIEEEPWGPRSIDPATLDPIRDQLRARAEHLARERHQERMPK